MYMVMREMLMKRLEIIGEREDEGGRAELEELGFGSVGEALKVADLLMEDYRKGCLMNMTICQWIGEGLRI
ncbi:hypothetical protein TWF718_011165 [Orbilia javanica]|uniref:Uncharacterized protein n=1 Tax=Orbilia javanica TaxID=47235 RepID=A0AAN8MPN2_9PEZI